jgi:membrane protease YdiL (CAAX protease family)
MADMQLSMSNPAFANQVRVTQTLLSIFIFLFPALLTARIINTRPLKLLGFSHQSSWKTYGTAIIIMLIMIVIAGSLTTLNEMIPVTPSMKLYFTEMEDKYMQQVEVMSQMKGIPDLLISLVVMAFVPAFVEEVFFRGGFQNLMHRSTGNMWVSIIVTSLLFSAIHFSFYGFFARTALGIVLGLLFATSQNIWVPILAHFVNNAIAVGQVYYLRSTGQSLAENMDDTFPLWLGLFHIVFFFFAYRRFEKTLE